MATLVRSEPHPLTAWAKPLHDVDVLYVHGWSDYFFQTELARFWTHLGARFHALDLRRYGRSLRPGQTPGYIESLDDYGVDIEAALAAMGQGRDAGTSRRLVLLGHSTGGLTLTLWSARNPGRAAALVLNSPWLELQGSSVLRHISAPAVARIARFQPKAPLPNIDPGYYARTLSSASGGEWTYDATWRPTPSFPVRAGWLQAIMAGHARVARGLSI